MAISALECILLRDLKQQGILPQQCDMLEFGESNWYGDVGMKDFADLITMLAPDRAEALKSRLDALDEKDDLYAFDLAKLFFDVTFDPKSYTAIDYGGPTAIKENLNEPISLDKQFDITIDFGTAEHVFNIYQFFKTAHELTKPGGVMIHGLPFTGFFDHGFYNFQPTFFWDLMLANGYQPIIILVGAVDPFSVQPLTSREQIIQMVKANQIPKHSLLYAVCRKGEEESKFQVPQQGYYNAGVRSDEMAQAWQKDLRNA